jgi:sugar phosphate isomerase/epimerase
MGFSIDIVKNNLCFSAKFPWNIGIVSFMAYPSMMEGKEIYSSIKKIAEDGFFDLIELPVLSNEDLSSIAPLLKNKNVSIGLQPFIFKEKININSLNSNERKRAIDAIKKEIDKASKHGICTIALCSGPDVEKGKREEAKKLLVDSLNDICSYASKYGINIVFETFDRAHDKKLLIGPKNEAVEIIKKVREKNKNIGLLWDLSHAPLLNEKPEDVKEIKEYLFHIHIGCGKEVDGKLYDWHPVFHTKGALNTEEDIAKLLKALFEINYCGAISFEIKPEADQTSELVINAAKGSLIKAFQIFIEKL